MLFGRKKDSAVQIPEGTVRLHIIWEGDVQAVGLRYTARQVAAASGVTGWIRNCDDGTVEAEIQGAPAQVAAFEEEIRQLSASPRSWIDARVAQRSAIAPQAETSFRIR